MQESTETSATPPATEAPEPIDPAALVERTLDGLDLGPLLANWEAWEVPLATALLMAMVLLVVHVLAARIAARLSRRTTNTLDESIVMAVSGPTRLLIPVMGALFILRSAHAQALEAGGPAAAVLGGARQACAIGAIVAFTWLAVRLVNVGASRLLRAHDVTVSDNLRARQVHTQLRVVTRIASIIIWIIGVASLLMTFESIRQVGASLLASAGLAGLIIGFAAQRVIGNFLAGLQIAPAQPIALDDVVVISGEWGRIEEITSTYVVVKIWDDRRLIVPFSHIIEQPFTNWTRRTSQILGTVFIHADYTVPVDEVRAELDRIVKDHPKWDRRAAGLQVTEADARSVQLRVVVSASNASNAWDLRCDIREKLIAFLQRKHPECLPRVRSEVEGPPALASAGADA